VVAFLTYFKITFTDTRKYKEMEWKGGAILMVLISIQSALGGDQSCPPEGVKNIRNGLNLFSHSIDKVRVSTLVNRNI